MERRNRVSRAWVLVAGVLFLPVLGFGVDVGINTPDKKWSGNGSDPLWSNPDNWTLDTGGPLEGENGDIITFDSHQGQTTNDISNITFSKIHFSSTSGSFNLGGNSITFTGLHTLITQSTATQTISLSGDLINLRNITANAGTLIINSTISTPGAGLDIIGGGNVIFNKPLVGLNRLSVSGDTIAQFNSTVSTSIAFGHATVIISSGTALPGASISEYGVLKIASDVTLSGSLFLVDEGFIIQSTAPTVDTNGFEMTVTNGIKNGENSYSEVLPAKLIKTGEGVLVVAGDNTNDGWTGGTTLSGGTLRAGSATAFHSSSSSFTLADKAGVVLDLNGHSFTLSELNGGGENGGTVLLPSGTLTIAAEETSSRFAGRIVGAGSLVKEGGGVLWLTGANDEFSGTTIVNAGILKGDARGLHGDIINHASVVFDQSGTGTYGGEMTGEGSLQKTGAGTLTISGSNTFSGGTTVSSGTLVIGNSGALGNGNVTVEEGVLKTDGTPRDIFVNGNFVQSGGTLELTLYSAGQIDRLVATGTVSVGGRLTVGPRPGYLPVGTSTYSIVQGTVMDGMFGSISSGAALQFEVTYTSTQTILTSTKKEYAPFVQTSNASNVAHYLDMLYPTATGDLALVLWELNAMPATDLSNAVKSLSPQPYQTMTALGMSTLSGFSQRIHSQLARSRAGSRGIQSWDSEEHGDQTRWGALTAEAGILDSRIEDDPFFDPEKLWNVFMTADGLYASLPGDNDVGSGNVVSGGITAGIDYRWSPQWTFGLGLGYALSSGETGNDEMSIDGKSLTPGMYGSYANDHYYVDGILALQNSDYTTKRRVMYGSNNMVASASPKSKAYALGVEAGLPLRSGTWEFVPLGGLQLAEETVNAFEETGAGAVSLSVSEQNRSSLASLAGIRVSHALSTDSRDRFELRSAWRHEFDGQTTIDASFVGAGGSFSVAGSDPKKNSVLVGGELSAGFSDALSLVFSYDGDFGDVSVHRVHGTARFQF